MRRAVFVSERSHSLSENIGRTISSASGSSSRQGDPTEQSSSTASSGFWTGMYSFITYTDGFCTVSTSNPGRRENEI